MAGRPRPSRPVGSTSSRPVEMPREISRLDKRIPGPAASTSADTGVDSDRAVSCLWRELLPLELRLASLDEGLDALAEVLAVEHRLLDLVDRGDRGGFA